MATTVNGFGGSGGGEALRGDYIIKVIDAPGTALSNITASSNNTPPAESMQKLLDISGPGRLLLLAPYASSNNAEVRVRVDADDRVIYKACKGKVLFNYYSDSNYHSSNTIPAVIFAPGAFGPASEAYSGNNVLYPGTAFVLPKYKYFPNYTFYTNDDPYGMITTEHIDRISGRGVENAVDFHTRDDDNRIGELDYWRSAFYGGLYFDDNLTIRAAYGSAPDGHQTNGIFVVYQLFDV